MSKIEAEQLSNIAGDRVGLVGGIIRGFAKAWCRLNQVTGTIIDSENVSSVTDNAAGSFTQNFTNAFANSNYATVSSVATQLSANLYFVGGNMSSTPTTWTGVARNNAGGNTDIDNANHVHMGDLA